MMKIINWSMLSEFEKTSLLKRPSEKQSDECTLITQKIIDRVKNEGDPALYDFTQRFDQAKLATLIVSEQEFQQAETSVPQKDRDAMLYAIQQNRRYQNALLPSTIKIQTDIGVFCEKQTRPIDKVGLYVPGGTAPLVSTVIMLAIPASIAGCNERILCTPPNADGKIDPRLLFAAQQCGITKVYKLGGAQAIAAMAYGTESIQKVDKIFGPGNAWVTEAKKQVAQSNAYVSIDMPAGPSEVLVIADDAADPEIVAADLLSQAEHGPDSQVFALTVSKQQAEAINRTLSQQLYTLPRESIANKALKNSRIIVTDSLESAVSLSNQYAPEHLILQIDNPEDYLPMIQNAGAVFIGPWTSETSGDYVTGANHVLPTAGYARSVSGLSVNDFLKWISIQKVTASGLNSLAKQAERLAEMEGLEAHKKAMSLRREKCDELMC